MVSAKAIELIAHAIEKSGDSYDKIAAATTISKTTLCRLVKQHTASRYTLDVLASYFGLGEQYQALVGDQDHSCAFASELTEELRQVRSYYEQKAASVHEHYEQQLTALRDQITRQELERDRERRALQDSCDKSVAYLKDEIARLRGELDRARADASTASASIKELTGKKSSWLVSLVAITALMAVALIISLLTNAI